jgi:hypothetical protein
VLRGALITDLAASARRAGFTAEVVTLAADSIPALLRAGVPPVLLYARGLGPVTRGHYGVVVGWEPRADRYVLHEGGSKPRVMTRRELERKWRPMGFQALVVRHST